MADVLLVLIVVTFFALCVLYVRGLARVIDRDDAPETGGEQATTLEEAVR